MYFIIPPIPDAKLMDIHKWENQWLFMRYILSTSLCSLSFQILSSVSCQWTELSRELCEITWQVRERENRDKDWSIRRSQWIHDGEHQFKSMLGMRIIHENDRDESERHITDNEVEVDNVVVLIPGPKTNMIKDIQCGEAKERVFDIETRAWDPQRGQADDKVPQGNREWVMRLKSTLQIRW